jgi:hypothetical protein
MFAAAWNPNQLGNCSQAGRRCTDAVLKGRAVPPGERKNIYPDACLTEEIMLS